MLRSPTLADPETGGFYAPVKLESMDDDRLMLAIVIACVTIAVGALVALALLFLL